MEATSIVSSYTHNKVLRRSSSPISKRHTETMKDHQCHHYMSTYGGYAARALVMGFAGTLGADAANAVVGEARKEWDKK